MKTDLYNHPDHYAMDDLLSEEHKLVRDAARAWVKKEVSPIIDEHYEKATFPMHLLKGLGEIGAFGPYIPEEYGGPRRQSAGRSETFSKGKGFQSI